MVFRIFGHPEIIHAKTISHVLTRSFLPNWDWLLNFCPSRMSPNPSLMLRPFMRKNDKSHDFITGLLTSYYY